MLVSLHIYIYFFFFSYHVLYFFSIFVKSHDKFDLRRRKMGSLFYSGRSGIMEEFSFVTTILLPIIVPTLPVLRLFFSSQVRFRFKIKNSSVPLYFGKITQELHTTYFPHGVGLAS